jgi:transcriptional regulator with XRE-family HTH domain
MPNIMGNFKTLPLESAAHVLELGRRVRLARLRRGLSVADLSAKAGINRNTLTSLEKGKSGVGLGTLITVLWALGLEHTLDAVAHPDSDTHGKTLEAARRPKRTRKAIAKNEYDF